LGVASGFVEGLTGRGNIFRLALSTTIFHLIAGAPVGGSRLTISPVLGTYPPRAAPGAGVSLMIL
jgi:hypothetical protein